MFELYEQGGLVVIPLGICSVIAFAVILERLWFTRRSRILPHNLDYQIAELLRASKVEEAISICRRDDSPLARVLLSGLRFLGRTREDLVDAVELTGKRELSALLRYVSTLGTIAAIAPLLGLLGTVTGIIRTFGLIEEHGIGNPQLLAGGISQALIATASGICIAVPTMIFYRFFMQRARSLALELEESAHLLLFELPRPSER